MNTSKDKFKKPAKMAPNDVVHDVGHGQSRAHKKVLIDESQIDQFFTHFLMFFSKLILQL